VLVNARRQIICNVDILLLYECSSSPKAPTQLRWQNGRLRITLRRRASQRCECSCTPRVFPCRASVFLRDDHRANPKPGELLAAPGELLVFISSSLPPRMQVKGDGDFWAGDGAATATVPGAFTGAESEVEAQLIGQQALGGNLMRGAVPETSKYTAGVFNGVAGGGAAGGGGGVAGAQGRQPADEGWGLTDECRSPRHGGQGESLVPPYTRGSVSL